MLQVLTLYVNVFPTGVIFASISMQTVSYIHFLFLAMLLHPDVQKKAQQELDRVIGTDRLPELSDEKELPYITAIMKEIFRWAIILPMGRWNFGVVILRSLIGFLNAGVGHVSSEDEIYDGYMIPKRATVMWNGW